MSHEVLEGDRGWLFLSGGTNEVLELFNGAVDLRALSAEWVSLLRARYVRAESLGARYLHLPVPDKLAVRGEFAGIDLTFAGGLCEVLAEHMADSPGGGWGARAYVDVLDALRSRHDSYFKTDSHWTPEGAYAAYRVLCQHVGVHAIEGLLDYRVATIDIALDLGAKVDPVRIETYRQFQGTGSVERVWANRLVIHKEDAGLMDSPGLHVGSAVRFRNHSPDAVRERVMVFGDSYSEYRPHVLTGMLAETFADVFFVWSADLDWRLVEQIKPTILLTELAERFHRRVPTDAFDLDTYVRSLGL